MNARPFIARRSLAILFAFAIVSSEIAVSYPMFVAARDAALSRRFSAVDAGGIGFIAGLCFFMLVYFLVAALLVLIRQARSKE